MLELQTGQRQPLTALGLSENLEIRIECDLKSIDLVAFGLEKGKLTDDRYMIFYNQPASPEKALSQSAENLFLADLQKLPANIDEIYFTVSHDQQPISDAKTLQITLNQHVTFSPEHLQAEKAVILLRFYRHQQTWRVAAVGQGFHGGLAALVKHFGGEVAEEAAPPVSKLDLRKEKVKIELKKLGIAEEKLRVMVVMDASGSMYWQYKKGIVQELLERLIPVAARLDSNSELDFFYYAENFADCGTVTEHSMADFVGSDLPQRRNPQQFSFLGGRNNEPKVMTAIVEKHHQEREPTPTLVLFINDGGVSRNGAIKKILRESSKDDIFWQFIGLGNANYGILRELDTLGGRVVDNAGFFAVDDIEQITDDELYQRLLSELPKWLRAARAAGIVP